LDATVVGTTTRRSLHHFYRRDPFASAPLHRVCGRHCLAIALKLTAAGADRNRQSCHPATPAAEFTLPGVEERITLIVRFWRSRIAAIAHISFTSESALQRADSRADARRKCPSDRVCRREVLAFWLSSMTGVCECRPFASAIRPIAGVGRRCQSSVLMTLPLARPCST
jgi:hypothetical protein